MQESPEAIESTTNQADVRPPLGVRMIAGVLLVMGVWSAVRQFITWWIEDEFNFPASVLILLIGWGLLRRREWARKLTCILAFLFCFAGSIALFVALWSTGNLLFNADTLIVGDLFSKTLAILAAGALTGGSYWAFRYTQDVRPGDWFLDHPPIRPFIQWNPALWRFSLTSLFFLTVVVAVSTATVVFHPAVKAMHARMLVKQAMSDPVYFPPRAPSKAPAIPTLGPVGWSVQGMGVDGNSATLHWIAEKSPNEPAMPNLVFVVFADASSHWSVDFSQGSVETARLTVHEEVLVFEPDRSAQLCEYHDGRLHQSEMQISLVELWSYLYYPHSSNPNYDWTVADLETYIKDLRRRVAEREAKNSHP
ncbi:hypothetical protein NG895_25235 [Aeoliella sp. ICT_H6.2]|uniref:Transmembrane protein n=1 Tax=Aeoliella straminimaris TaxID=2954799 RepID=A0A9X2JJ47_9BACT|nr:hypothetical protein [Aeoliella straminimaris]MCO6047217.1 hypothetical protein [Aeoliella straminimaris]